MPEAQAALQQLLEAKKEKQALLDATFDELKDCTEPIRMAMEAKQKDMIPLKKTVNKCQKNVSVADGELKLVSERMERATTQFEQLQGKLAKVKPDITAKVSRVRAQPHKVLCTK